MIFHVYNDISDNDSSSSDDIITSNPLPFKIVNSEEDRPPLKQFNNNCKYDSFFIPDINQFNIPDKVSSFELIFSEDILQLIINATNERANLFFKKHTTKNHKIHGLKWKPVTIKEMRIFTYLLLNMTLVKLPTIHDYWCYSPVVTGPSIYTKNIMSRDRFLQILKFLRFNKSSEFIKGEPWSRLNSFTNCIRQKFRELVDPKMNVAIDESLMPFKGKLHIKRYIPNKRSRFGVKIFVLASSSPELRGYTSDFILDYGKDDFKIPQCSLKISERIIVKLLDDNKLLNSGCQVITDNWYNSRNLADYLFENKTYLLGTINPKRGLPKILQKKNLKLYDSAFARSKHVLISKWRAKSNKCVHVISTKYTARKFHKKQKYYKGKKISFLKPHVIEKYNQYMGSVDQIDQMLHGRKLEMKSFTWFKKVGLHILSRAALNSMVIFKNLHDIPKKKLHMLIILKV